MPAHDDLTDPPPSTYQPLVADVAGEAIATLLARAVAISISRHLRSWNVIDSAPHHKKMGEKHNRLINDMFTTTALACRSWSVKVEGPGLLSSRGNSSMAADRRHDCRSPPMTIPEPSIRKCALEWGFLASCIHQPLSPSTLSLFHEPLSPTAPVARRMGGLLATHNSGRLAAHSGEE